MKVECDAERLERLFRAQVRGRMQHLKEDLFEKVAAVLESPDDSPNGQAALRAALSGRWKAALDKTARFWARQRSSSSAARAELQSRLKDLHEDIHATIDAEVGSSPLTEGAHAQILNPAVGRALSLPALTCALMGFLLTRLDMTPPTLDMSRAYPIALHTS